MTDTSAGTSLPAGRNTQRPNIYRSGHCGSNCHDRCLGVYAGCDCTCDCHQSPPDPPPPVLRAHCGTCTCHMSVVVPSRPVYSPVLGVTS